MSSNIVITHKWQDADRLYIFSTPENNPKYGYTYWDKINPPTLGDHSQPLNVQYLVHISFVLINHTDPLSTLSWKAQRSLETTVKITISNYNAGCIACIQCTILSCWRNCLYILCTILSCWRINRLPIINHHQPVRLASLQHPLGFPVTCNL